ncbi:MAG: hypothetical protein ACK4QP_12425 [Pseudorhizobium sp.]
MSRVDDLLGTVFAMQMLQEQLLRYVAKDPAGAASIVGRAIEQVETSGSCFSSGAIAYLEALSASVKGSCAPVAELQ